MDYPRENFWPSAIESIKQEDTLKWIEKHLWFINLSPRDEKFEVLSDTKIDAPGAKALAEAATGLWQSIIERDLLSFGNYFRKSFEAQIAMFPHMVTPKITETIRFYEKEVLGWKIMGAGGGGYLVLVSEKPVLNAIQIRIRRG